MRIPRRAMRVWEEGDDGRSFGARCLDWDVFGTAGYPWWMISRLKIWIPETAYGRLKAETPQAFENEASTYITPGQGQLF